MEIKFQRQATISFHILQKVISGVVECWIWFMSNMWFADGHNTCLGFLYEQLQHQSTDQQFLTMQMKEQFILGTEYSD